MTSLKRLDKLIEKKLYEAGKKYQKTGVYPRVVQKLEDDYVDNNLVEWYHKWKKCYDNMKHEDDRYMSLNSLIGLEIGMWQSKYGFVLSADHPKIKKMLGSKK
jgi:hypothetical protein